MAFEVLRKTQEVVHDLGDVIEAASRLVDLKNSAAFLASESGSLLMPKDQHGDSTSHLGIKSLIVKVVVTEEPPIRESAGETLFKEFREDLLPNVNMSQLVFSKRTRMHSARFFVPQGNVDPTVFSALKKKGATPRQILLLPYEQAVPEYLLAWIDKYKNVKSWTTNVFEDCIRELADAIRLNLKAFERHANSTYVSQCSQFFTGGFEAGFLESVQRRANGVSLDQFDSFKERSEILWGYRLTDASGEQTWEDLDDPSKAARKGINLPDVSRHSFWWALYMAKCALNPNEYSIFLANPSFHGEDRSGIVIVADLFQSPDEGLLFQQLMGLELCAQALLSGVARLTLEDIDRKKAKTEKDRIRLQEQLRHEQQSLVSFGHDGKRPAYTLVQVMQQDWPLDDKLQVAKLLAQSLYFRLGSYSALIGSTGSVEQARQRLLHDQGAACSTVSVSSIWYQEMISIVLRCLVDESGWEQIRQALWPEKSSKEIWAELRESILPVCTASGSSKPEYRNRLPMALSSCVEQLKTHGICIDFSGIDFIVPTLCDGNNGYPTEPRLHIALAFILSELATNAFKHQFQETRSLLKVSGLQAKLEVQRAGSTFTLICRFSPIDPLVRRATTDWRNDTNKTFRGLASLQSTIESIGCEAHRETILWRSQWEESRFYRTLKLSLMTEAKQIQVVGQ